LKTTSRSFPGFLAAAVVFLMTAQAWPQDVGDNGQKAPDNGMVNAPSASDGADAKAAEKPVLEMNPYVPVEDFARTGVSGHFVDLLEDQKRIWTSPSKIRFSDVNWLVPLGGITAGLFVTDSQFSASLNQNPTTIKHYKDVSNYGLAGLIGAAGGLYVLSFPTHNDHWRETGFLAGEAALNSLITVEALKYSLQRESPYEGNGAGRFFSGGSSFPSQHSAVAWSIAGVFAHEYPGTIPSLFAYGAASAISLSRIKAREHFPSDVLVGSVLGYLISQNVYRHRHNPEVGGAAWESPRELANDDTVRRPAFMGSPYVPLDSWVYPAMERLAALGYLKSADLNTRPWTRLECTRLLNEAGELLPETTASPEVQQLYSALSQEFARDAELMSGESNRSAQLESVYARAVGIAGKPLTDNYHFGQTILNDYGRPYEEGFNSVAGLSGWTTTGPFVVYTRGEYQSAPSAPSLSPAALNFISSVDGLPPNPPSLPVAAISRFQLLDAYVGMNVANWQFSFGRRSLWWGPSDSGAMLFTNNIPPMNKMFTIDRVSPFELPGPLRYFGQIRLQAFIGQVSGQEFINNAFFGSGSLVGSYGQPLRPQPFISGGRITFKLTQNFEFGMTKTTLYGGPGNPLTPTTLFKSTFGIHVNGDGLGDGRSGADFSYRIPKLRDWLTFYGEAMSEDQPSPIPYMRQSIFQGGLYFAKIPRIPKLDLRLEGGSTNAVGYNAEPAGYFYWNEQYVNGYTSDGSFIGSWLGRAAQGESIRTSYWISARQKIGLELRHRAVSHFFLPQGGNQNDVALNADIFTGQDFRFTGNLQYERWQIPLLATNRQSNVVASFQFGFWPRFRHQ
jgi:membrane-associated phospholipid phosphatase